jgi:hypothetical protein
LVSLDLKHADLRRPCCLRRLEVQFNRFLEVGKRLFPSLALAGDVEFQALGKLVRGGTVGEGDVRQEAYASKRLI